MSTRDRLSKLTADLLKPETLLEPKATSTDSSEVQPVNDPIVPSGVETRFPLVSPRPAGSKTAPGNLVAFRGQLMAAEDESQQLKERLKHFEDSLPSKKLDPNKIVLSRWANRHESSYSTPAFIRFKAEIEHAGGNVQPILVRPIHGDSDRYELIYGHRRHRACLESGLPVLALIWTESLTNSELFTLMDRENRERTDLSAWEQGTMYKRALEDEIFTSLRRLAESLGVSHTWVRKAIAVAELPEPIIECFKSPLEVTHRLAEELSAALQQDRKGVLRRAEKLRQSERVSASAVVAVLVGKQRGGPVGPREIRVNSKVVGRVTWDARGQVVVRLLPGVVASENLDTLIETLSAAVEKVAN